MEVTPRVQNVFRKVFKNPELQIKNDLTSADIKGWDSLRHIQLVVSLEKEFAIKFHAEEIVQLENVGDLLKLVEGKLKQ